MFVQTRVKKEKLMRLVSRTACLLLILIFGVGVAAAYQDYDMNCNSASCGPNTYKVKQDQHTTVHGTCKQVDTIISMPKCHWQNNATEGNPACTKQPVNDQNMTCTCHNETWVSPLDMNVEVACTPK